MYVKPRIDKVLERFSESRRTRRATADAERTAFVEAIAASQTLRWETTVDEMRIRLPAIAISVSGLLVSCGAYLTMHSFPVWATLLWLAAALAYMAGLVGAERADALRATVKAATQAVQITPKTDQTAPDR